MHGSGIGRAMHCLGPFVVKEFGQVGLRFQIATASRQRLRPMGDAWEGRLMTMKHIAC